MDNLKDCISIAFEKGFVPLWCMAQSNQLQHPEVDLPSAFLPPPHPEAGLLSALALPQHPLKGSGDWYGSTSASYKQT